MDRTAADVLIAHGLERHQSGDLESAAQIYRQVLQSCPHHPEALHLLGMVYKAVKQYALALDYLERAIAVAPEKPNYYHNLALVLRCLDRNAQAAEAFEQALRLQPDAAVTLTCYGSLLQDLGRCEQAVTSHQQAVALQPQFADAWSNLGLAHRACGRMQEALNCLRRASQIAPEASDIHHNLGNALLDHGDPVAAESSLRQALRLAPNHFRARCDLGAACHRQGQLKQAEAEYRRAISTDPDNADAHWNLGLVLLMAGRYQEGWHEYEWRRRIPAIPIRQFSQPSWSGDSLNGRTLLVHAEQGLGDAIQFAAFVPMAQQRAEAEGGVFVFESHSPLVRLLSSLKSAGRIIERGQQLPVFDVQLPLLSMPAVLGSGASIPADVVPYLFAEPELVDQWVRRLHSSARLNVGIAFQGNPEYRADRERSVPLRYFKPLAELTGVKLYSLQKKHGLDQLDELAPEFGIENLGPELDEQTGAFVDTAAVIEALDLVICSDSAIAHLAGALGAKIWMVLPEVPDWRWGLSGSRSPWYPTMRLCRQRRLGDWDEGMARVGAALRDEA